MRTGRKRALCAAALSLSLLLGGCVSSLPQEKQATGQELPTVRPGLTPTTGDAQAARAYTAILYVPDDSGTRLMPETHRIIVQTGQTKQEACVSALLQRVSASGLNTTGEELRLSAVSNAVETSGGLATVNLHTSIPALPESLEFALRMAIVNTLTELGETNYVNILINGRDPGLRVATTAGAQTDEEGEPIVTTPTPTGVSARYANNDITSHWSQQQLQAQREAESSELSRTAALYFLSEDGQYLLGEARNLTFVQQTPAAYALGLIDALSKGSTSRGMQTLVPPADYFERDPAAVTVGEGLYIELRLRPEVDDYLRAGGGTQAMMLSSICYTLTSFIPGLSGIITYIDGTLVSELTLMNGDIWTSPTGQMSRESALALAADICTIYFPLENEAGLYPVIRPIAQRLRTQPRALLLELMQPPGTPGLTRALPDGIADADILGLQIQGDTALVNLSRAFWDACQSLNSTQERNLIYAIVNTLTELEEVRRVRFFIEGEQTQLTGSMFIGGEFLRHTGLIYSGTL